MAVVNRSKNKRSSQNDEKSGLSDDDNKYSKLNNDKYEFIAQNWLLSPLPAPKYHYTIWITISTLIAFITRFWKIWEPKEVVFDEVHFGKFASYYLQGTYFFDVHPPFAKMLIAFIGYLRGYDGSFKFDDIGLPYNDTNNAPFIAYRSFNALLGTLTVPIVFNTMKELNCKAITCAFASLLIALDNAHITETRLILLDATLLISIAMTIYCYVVFYKAQLKAPFSKSWYLWLFLTGVSLSFVISTKYVGMLTYAMIGIAVLVNLWQLLDIDAGLSIKQFTRHFVKRLSGLIIAPFLIYLFWFYIHFAVLNKSGPGDSFMPYEFQETLADSPYAEDIKQVNFFDIITLKHKDTENFLHSHLANYPLRYEDGRVSSQGQIVTTTDDEDDLFNRWEIIPADLEVAAKRSKFYPVHLNEHFRLRHVETDTYLLAHDVASPFFPTNEEIVTVSEEEAFNDAYQQTIFTFQPLNNKDSGKIVNTKNIPFRIFHVDTAVVLWTHDDVQLPEWASFQYEVNGNKQVQEPQNNWIVDAITNLDDDRLIYVPKVVTKMPFLKKWFISQKLMFEHNNKLSSEHPFASQPDSWPLCMSGVSFWTSDPESRQIYFIGNLFGWWVQVFSILIFSIVIASDLITRQRGIYAFNKMTREKLYGPLLFLLIGWGCHYFPFFLMGRQKFLHHYLPAHLILSLFTAGLWELLFSCKFNVNKEVEKDEKRPIEQPKIFIKYYGIFLIVMLIGLFSCFMFFAPITYGWPSTPQGNIRRQLLNIKLNYISLKTESN